jgi:hypothetical protein
VAPVYAPEVTAKVILECAERPRRDVKVGWTAKKISLAQTLSPRLTDHWMQRSTFEDQRSDRPVAPEREDNLFAAVDDDGGERGLAAIGNGRVRRRSLYTWAALNPVRAVVALSAIGLGLVAGSRAARKPRRRVRLATRRRG